MTRPKFSVVIPTRNRPALAKIAVETVLRQTFEDWELVFSDNSQNEETREMMREFNDPRIHYERVDDLSMCDNWEAACARAEGEYLCVLEDKQAFKFHALERIDEVTRKHEPEVVRWQWDSLDPYGLGYRIRRHGARGEVHQQTTDKCLRALVDGAYLDAKHKIPIAHYSAVRRDLRDNIKRGGFGRLFPVVAPDYTFAIQILNFAEHVTYIDEGLVCFSDATASNGLSIRMKTDLGNEFVASLGGEQVFFDHVPVKVCTIQGLIYNDYLRVRAKLGGRLELHEPNWVNYFFACHDAILSSMEMGIEMDGELAEWERALRLQTEEIKQAVAVRLAKTRTRRGSLGRRIRKSPPVLGLMRAAKSVLNGRILRREDWRFAHILPYLEHEAKKVAND